jgi:uncharacterized membrane protein HdeD (DUF308 family)
MPASALLGDELDLQRLSFTLLLRGAFVIPLAAVAIRWPESTLVLTMVVAGGVIGTFGIFELAAGLVSGTLPSTRWFFLGHGVVSIAFGVLTASIPVATSELALALSTGWLAFNAFFCLLLAARRWPDWRERLAILTWSLTNVVCAVALLLAPQPTTLGLLYALALYTFMLGVVQLAAAAWIHRVSSRLTSD